MYRTLLNNHKNILTTFALSTDLIVSRLLSTSTSRNLIQKYRQERGLPLNPNVDGPLTNLPDFTYLDGRPTPLGMRQKKRMQKQKDIAMKIIALSKQVDFAVKRHEENLKEQQESRDRILANKLKRKGHLIKNTNYE